MDELDDIDKQMIALFAGGHSAIEVASACGNTITTVYRRKGRPAFKIALTEARAGLFVPLANESMKRIPAALRRLARVIDDEGARDCDAIKAAMGTVELAFKFQEQVDIRVALAELQHSLAQVQSSRAADASPEPSDDGGDPDALPPEIAPQTGV